MAAIMKMFKGKEKAPSTSDAIQVIFYENDTFYLRSTKPKCDARLLLNLPILYVILLQLIEYETDPYFLPASQSATIRDQLLIYLFCKGCKPEVIWT